MYYLQKRVLYSIVILCFLFGASSMAHAYQVYDCWTSHDGWGESASNFTTNSEAVYLNVRASVYTGFMTNKWYRPDGTRENDIGTNILAHPVYEGGLFVGFWTYMVIKGKDREPGEWHVEHWVQDVNRDWYRMCTAYFTITKAVANPIFSPQPGTYTTPQTITLSCATSSATIYYTTDGSAPTESSLLYSAPIAISETTTLKVKAYKSGLAQSDTVTGLYRIAKPMPFIPLLLDE
jgi:hypothetical protein